MPNPTNHHLRFTPAIIAIVLLAAACGGPDPSNEASDDPTAAETTETAVDTSSDEARETSPADGGDAEVERQPIAGEAPPDLSFLDPAVQDLVEFEASWQCDLARFAVQELSAIDSLLAERRAEFGVTEDGYVAFQERLAVDPELRDLVADQTSSCIEAGESVQL